jgi:hypothetical protein
MTMITGEQNIRTFHYLQLIHGLALEINTGMKLSSRGSVMVAAKKVSGSDKQTKRGVLLDMVRFTMSEDIRYVASDRVLKALAHKFAKTTEKAMHTLDESPAGTPVNYVWPDRVMFELLMLGAIVIDTERSTEEEFFYKVGTITPATLAFAANH